MGSTLGMRFAWAIALSCILSVGHPAQAQEHADHSWKSKSQALLLEYLNEIGKLSPHSASEQGLDSFDTQVTPWSDDYDSAFEQFYLRWKEKLKSLLQHEIDSNLKIDIEILLTEVEYQLRDQALNEQFKPVPYWAASEDLYAEFYAIANPQSPPARRRNIVTKLFFMLRPAEGQMTAFQYWQRAIRSSLQESNSSIGTPTVMQVQDYLEHSATYMDAIENLFKESGALNWGGDLAELRRQVKEYDAFIRDELLPLCRSDHRMPSELYAHELEGSGVRSQSMTRIEARAAHQYEEWLNELGAAARALGEQMGLPAEERTPRGLSEHFRSRHNEAGSNPLPFVASLTQELDALIRTHRLMSLPDQPPRVRISTPAETAEMPFAFLSVPAMALNRGELPEFVYPMDGDTPVDADATHRAGTMTLVAHETRPGHELQYRRAMETSAIRSIFSRDAMAEGWAVYVERLLLPLYPDAVARYGALQSLLFRAARAFLDPQVQRGQIGRDEVMRHFVEEMGMDPEFAEGEYERYTWRSPGQAVAYYSGMERLWSLRKRQLQKPGFSEMAFHDLILTHGPIHLELCERLFRH